MVILRLTRSAGIEGDRRVSSLQVDDPVADNPAGVFLGFVMGQGNEDLLQVIRPIHEFFTNAVTVVIVLRLLAALYHHFVAKDVASAKLLPNRLIY
ncbi:MAG: hypothetical protein P8J17_00025 [Halioglobus sp.]|nr:hypothetical protein [Halioglobus sp.]